MRAIKFKKTLAILVIIFLALVVKYIYLRTAERLVDIEELPLAPLRLIAGMPSGSDFASTRLYTIGYITNAIFLWIFGFNISALKLTSFAFFIASCVGMLKVGYDWFEKSPTWVKWLPACLIAFGPPVAQMWALKNRGGFIETWAILAWVIWLYGRWVSLPEDKGYLVLLGALCGIALWAQPIAAVYVLPVFVGVAWQSLSRGWARAISSMGWLSFSTLLGAMPLIALNFIFNFNTLKVIEGGEGGQGADTPARRFVRLLAEGLPRLAGLKQQWHKAWVLPEYLSVVLLILFFAVAAAAIIIALKGSIKLRKFGAPAFCSCVVLVIIVMNVMTSWGAFQGEPRRLLLLYVPICLLAVLLLAQRTRWLIGFSLCWFMVSAYSNVAYVKANLNGYAIWAYKNNYQTTAYLINRRINNLYVNIWWGAKFEFESKMVIKTLKNPYDQPIRAVSGGLFDNRSAAIFQNNMAAQLSASHRMADDLRVAGITCLTADTGEFHVFYACSKPFDLYRLPRLAEQIRSFADAKVIFDEKKYKNGYFSGLYGSEPSHVWTLPEFSLPFDQKSSSSGLVCIKYGALRPLSASDIRVSLDGRELELKTLPSKEGNNYIVSTSNVQVASGFHDLRVRTPYFLPAAGGSQDLRVLGLPLETVSIVNAADMCGERSHDDSAAPIERKGLH